MDVVVLIGRILFALLFLGSGVAHITQRQMMTGYAASKKVPAAGVVVLASGVLIVVGALMVAVGVWPDLGALLLAVFLVPTAFLMHGFWAETDATARMNEQTHFLKDIALAGAALVMFGLFAHLGDDLGLVVLGPLFELP